MPAQDIRVDLALVHYPVSNKHGETIGSAVTNLDLHDIARAGCTFGIDTLYIVTPYEDQHELVQDILDHWLIGHGSTYNVNRKEALSIVRLCKDLAELYEMVSAKWQKRPTVLATSAQAHGTQDSFAETREKIFAGVPHLILFGTAWGMTSDVFADVDGQLPPISGYGSYNHLSVRSAAAIVMDRLLGKH
ncbi:MAG TPA: RNA methyltransferase [Deltaproteobacteria bacterium]|nr:RNA methyltransferase [Deltaproteobacteria bacterium]